jgi:hypothetical protein
MSGVKFVFCEGGDDLAIITGVANSIGLNALTVERFLGKTKLHEFLRDARLRPEFSRQQVESLAVVRDADEDDKAAFQSVCDSLRNNGFAVPAANGGFADGRPKVGVLIVGPNGGSGMVEDLCLKSVSDRPEFDCVDSYFRCIEQKSGRKNFSSKARLRVWMGSQPDYDLYVGKAAEKGYWPWGNPAFNELKAFLKAI